MKPKNEFTLLAGGHSGLVQLSGLLIMYIIKKYVYLGLMANLWIIFGM